MRSGVVALPLEAVARMKHVFGCSLGRAKAAREFVMHGCFAKLTSLQSLLGQTTVMHTGARSNLAVA